MLNAIKKSLLIMLFVAIINNNDIFAKVFDIDMIKDVKIVSTYTKDTLIDEIDSVRFGLYPQSDTNGEEKDPIEWIVLHVSEDKKEALLLSKYILDNKSYYHYWTDVVWFESDLRKWLNEDFYNSAFSDKDKERILLKDIKNNTDNSFGINGGQDSKDKLFCLSELECYEYFALDKEESKTLATNATQFAKNIDNNGERLNIGGGSRIYTDETRYAYPKAQKIIDIASRFLSDITGGDWCKNNSDYWLRTPGTSASNNTDYVMVVRNFGLIDDAQVHDKSVGVRPAMWISIE